MWGMVMRVTEPSPRALRLRQRLDRLGLPDRELSRLSGVNRSTIAKALRGESRSTTYGKLERVLADLEEESGLTDAEEFVAHLELADGTKVTFSGMTPEEAARAARAFLRERDAGGEGVS